MCRKGTRLSVGCKSDVGRRRATNEDAFLVDEAAGLFIVADGLGGHNAGEVASSLAVKEIGRHIAEDRGKDIHDAGFSVNHAILDANDTIIQTAEKCESLKGMGTTVVLALVLGAGMVVAHVGDSRAYLLRSGSLKRLTEDHSLVGRWVSQGIITSEAARYHPDRHTVLMALGIGNISPSIHYEPLQLQDQILLCSDGLTEMLTDMEIQKVILGVESPQHACNILVDDANQKGGRDNITIILYRHD